jgi:hypothetical protein
MEQTIDQKINALIEREREILKKMNIARLAGASEGILNQMSFLLDECKFQQQELRILQKSNSKDSDFDNYISIG